jgi:hypothetical protein
MTAFQHKVQRYFSKVYYHDLVCNHLVFRRNVMLSLLGYPEDDDSKFLLNVSTYLPKNHGLNRESWLK